MTTDRSDGGDGPDPGLSRLPGSAIAFFLVTFAITWAFFIPVAAIGDLDRRLARLLVFVGAVSPSLVALALTFRAEGTGGVRALLGRIVRGGVAGRWYLFAIGYFVSIELAAALIHRLATGGWPRFGDAASLAVILRDRALDARSGRRGIGLARLRATATGGPPRARPREHPAGCDLGHLASAALLRALGRHVRAVVPALRDQGHRDLGGDRVAGHAPVAACC
jgi:hypothetical protein